MLIGIHESFKCQVIVSVFVVWFFSYKVLFKCQVFEFCFCVNFVVMVYCDLVVSVVVLVFVRSL